MKRTLAISCLLAFVASAEVKRGDYNSKTTTLGVQASGCTTAGDTDCTVFGVCGAATSGGLCSAASAVYSIESFSNVALVITNSGANTLSDVLVEISNDASNWYVLDSTTYDELTAGTTKTSSLSANSYRFLRVEGRSASGTTAVVSVSVNDG